jgi:hypothetical protein
MIAEVARRIRANQLPIDVPALEFAHLTFLRIIETGEIRTLAVVAKRLLDEQLAIGTDEEIVVAFHARKRSHIEFLR